MTKPRKACAYVHVCVHVCASCVHARKWTQGFTHVVEAIYHWSNIPQIKNNRILLFFPNFGPYPVVFRDYSWWSLGNHMQCHKSNSGWSHAKQVTYLLYYHLQNLKIRNFRLQGKQKAEQISIETVARLWISLPSYNVITDYCSNQNDI